MKCVKCGRQKGKRACPALGGDICSTCCGTHRLKEISCPADCQWLGGLAVAAGLKEPPAEEVRAAANEINEAITAWFRTYPKRQWFADVALEEVFGDDDSDEGEQEWMLGLFMGGMHHGVVDEQGRRAVDIMIAEKARELRPAQVAVLRSLSKSWFSAFRVERVDRDVGILLRDTVDDREIFVHEKSGTHYIKPLEVVIAFISTTGGVDLFQGVARVPPAHATAIVEEVRLLLNESGITDRVAATPHVWGYVLGMLRERVLDWRPQLQNTDGEDLYPSKARFDVVDADALRRAFATHHELEAHDDGTGWSWHRGDDDGALSLGSFAINGTTLILEVNSRERLERGKALVASLAGAAVKHRIDEHMDMDRMLDDARGRASRASASSSDIPEDVKREVIGKTLRRFYANVLDEPVPMLGDKTPRQAARGDAGERRRVRDWLDGLEHSLLSMPGAEDAIDVDALRIELGFEPRSDDDDDDDDDSDEWTDDADGDDEGGEPYWADSFDPEEVEALADKVEQDPLAWLDEPTPLFDGQSPRAAAKDPSKRFMVHELLEGIDECLALAPRDFDAILKAIGLDATDLIYDPAKAPEPDAWLRYHARERELAVRRAHESGAPHPKIKDDVQHFIEHQVVEAWIARDAHDARAALARLIDAGLTRHEAIHALAATFARLLKRSIETEGEADEDIAAELAAVKPDKWRGTVG